MAAQAATYSCTKACSFEKKIGQDFLKKIEIETPEQDATKILKKNPAGIFFSVKGRGHLARYLRGTFKVPYKVHRKVP